MAGTYAHLYYLASPYSHKDPAIKAERAELATKAAIDLLAQGIFTFAPIPYNAPWEKYGLPGDWNFWQDFDKAFVSRMDAVVILTIDGWKESRGVTAEIEFANQNCIPVYYISLEQIANKDIAHIHPDVVRKDHMKLLQTSINEHIFGESKL